MIVISDVVDDYVSLKRKQKHPEKTQKTAT